MDLLRTVNNRYEHAPFFSEAVPEKRRLGLAEQEERNNKKLEAYCNELWGFLREKGNSLDSERGTKMIREGLKVAADVKQRENDRLKARNKAVEASIADYIKINRNKEKANVFLRKQNKRLGSKWDNGVINYLNVMRKKYNAKARSLKGKRGEEGRKREDAILTADVFERVMFKYGRPVNEAKPV